MPTLAPRRRVVLNDPKVAVLIDGSALYLATSHRPEGQRLNYHALNDLLITRVPGLISPGDHTDSIWTMWTSADPTNSGQMRFLEFAENRLAWRVRSCLPWQSYMVAPETLFGIGAGEGARTGRLMRFDASIAFAMGRLAPDYRLVVVSDSYALRDPIARVNENYAATTGKVVLAFFGQSLDPRWRSAQDDFGPEILDLDEHQHTLFGISPQEVRQPEKRPGPVF